MAIDIDIDIDRIIDTCRDDSCFPGAPVKDADALPHDRRMFGPDRLRAVFEKQDSGIGYARSS